MLCVTPDDHQVERWFFWLQRAPSATAQQGGVGRSAGARSEQRPSSGFSTEKGSAREVAARLQALMADPPHMSAQDAFRRAVLYMENQSPGGHQLNSMHAFVE